MTKVSTGQITIVDTNDGVNLSLDHPAFVAAVAADGSALTGSYTGCDATAKVLLGAVDDTANWTISCTPSASVTGSKTGNKYTVTALSADSGEVIFTATRSGYPTLTTTFDITRAKAGAQGAPGLNASTVMIYQRHSSATALSLPTLNATLTFATGAVTNLNNGWTTTVPPADVNKRYLQVSTATASSTTATDTILPSEWAPVQVLASDGSPGVGTQGPRGPVEIYTTFTGSAWDTPTAVAALSAGGYGAPQVFDTVTMRNTTTNAVFTRTYDNTSTWITVGQRFNGNLIVSGTVVADAINARSLILKSSTGADLVGDGVPLDPSLAANGTRNAESDYLPFQAWDFPNSNEGWVVNAGSITLNPNSITVFNSADLYIRSAAVSVPSINSIVRARVKRVAGTGWDGTVFFQTSAQASEGTNVGVKTAAKSPVIGEWVVLEFDMSANANWTGTVTRIRLDLGTTTADSFEVDWITVGRMAPGVTQAVVDAAATTAAWGSIVSKPADSAILNSGISIGANGSLSGAGGGQVTIGGLGYTGALDATKGADWATNVSNIPYATIFNNDDSVAMGWNPSFADWTGSAPAGWSTWGSGYVAPVKETTIKRLGTWSLKFTPTGADIGLTKKITFPGLGLPVGTFLTGAADMYLGAVTSGLPGMLVRIFHASTLYEEAKVMPTADVGGWQRVPFSLRFTGANVGKRIVAIQIYVMGSYTAMPSGSFTGTVYFDNFRFMLADDTTDNKTISISSDGTLSGAGGGSVTITGLGYSGDLNATNGAPAGTNVGGVAAATVATAVTNFNAANDRNNTAITAPTVDTTTGACVDHVINTDGSADISFDWAWAGAEGDIDGFLVYVRPSTSSAAYVIGTTPAEETVFTVPASKRAFILTATAANKYHTFGVRAYRSVDKDVAASGVILSGITQPSYTGENPYRPASTVAFAGNITGTINGTAVATVTTAVTAVNDATTGLAKRLQKNVNDILSAEVLLDVNGSIKLSSATDTTRISPAGIVSTKTVGGVSRNNYVQSADGAVTMREATVLGPNDEVILHTGKSLAQQTSVSPNLVSALNGWPTVSGAGVGAGYASTDARFINGQYMYLPSQAGYSGASSKVLNIPQNTTYTVSFDVYTLAGTRTFYANMTDGVTNTSGKVVTATTTSTHYTFTEQMTQANAANWWLRMYAVDAGTTGASIVFYNVKVEIGSVATPWCDNVITSANVSTFIASAAIKLAQIDKASIGTLSAISASVGTLTSRATVNGALSGAGTTITGDQIMVYDEAGALRILDGKLW